MKTHVKIMVFLVISLFAITAYSKSSAPKPEKIIKNAVNSTAKQKDIYFRITLGKDKRMVWDGYIKNNKEIMFFGTGIVGDDTKDKSEKKRVFYNGKQYLIETKTDVWEVADSSKIDNFGANNINGKLLKTPLDLFTLIKKYSMDDVSFADKDDDKENKDEDENDGKKDGEEIEEEKPADKTNVDFIKIVAKKDDKKSAKFIDYYSFWKELKKEEHWKDSKITEYFVQTLFTVNKKTELLHSVKFEYHVEFICNYGKGDDKCMGCLTEVGDEITYEFLDAKQVKLELPDSLKRKLGIKDVAEAKDGLKLSLSVSKSRINKGESIEFEVTWENVSKKDIKIKRILKSNPYLVFSIEGEIELSEGRFAGNEDRKEQYADDTPLVLKPGKTYREVFTMESDGRLADDETVRFLKTGQFYFKAKTKMNDSGEIVESNSVEVNIIP